MHPSLPLPSPRAIHSVATGWLPAAVALVFPPRCGFCRRDVDEAATADLPSAIVCDSCGDALAADSRPRCVRCAEPVATGDACGRCSARPWASIAVLGGYDGPLREAVLRGKRPNGDEGCRGLAALWLRRHALSARAWNCGCVVAVPLHWTRRLARGSSATDSLAAEIARGLGLRVSTGLRRVRATRMQNELPPEDRAGNVRGAFRCRRGFAGSRVLLVDDVVTTGATIAACCRALVAAGAAEVFVAAMAKADRGQVPGSPAE